MALSSSSALLLPAFCRGPVILRALVLAQAVAIVLAFAPGVTDDPWLRLGFVSLFVQWIMLTTSALLCILRAQLNSLPGPRLGIAVMAILLVVTASVSLVSHAVLAESLWFNPLSSGRFLAQNLLLALIVGLMAIQFFMLHTERHQRITAQSRAELVALQARIQPHFLFNSLNTVAELTQQDANAAEQALLDLAALFRAALHAGDNSTLVAELKLAQQYVALEQWRLGERLQVNWQLPAVVPDIAVPALLLQPLLENAIRHGIEPSAAGGHVDVSVTQHSKQIVILVVNPLSGEVPEVKGNGIALDNIRQRLALQFDSSASFSCAAVNGQYRVKLVLPLLGAQL